MKSFFVRSDNVCEVGWLLNERFVSDVKHFSFFVRKLTNPDFPMSKSLNLRTEIADKHPRTRIQKLRIRIVDLWSWMRILNEIWVPTFRFLITDPRSWSAIIVVSSMENPWSRFMKYELFSMFLCVAVLSFWNFGRVNLLNEPTESEDTGPWLVDYQSRD